MLFSVNQWGTWSFFIEKVIRKSLKNYKDKVQSSTKIQSADRPEIEFKVVCDRIRKFCQIPGILWRHRQLLTRFPVGWLYLGDVFDFPSSFFVLFLMTISIKKNRQVPFYYTEITDSFIYYLLISLLSVNIFFHHCPNLYRNRTVFTRKMYYSSKNSVYTPGEKNPRKYSHSRGAIFS